MLDKDYTTYGEAYRELWNAVTAFVQTPGDDELGLIATWDCLLDVLDRQNVQEFEQSSKSSNLSNAELTTVIPLEEPGDSDIYDEHIDKLKLDIPLGDLFNWTNVMEVCSVAKAQAYNIINYGLRQGVIVKARRGKFYWTE